MALHWNWEDKIGEAEIVLMHPDEEDVVKTVGLYEGNAFLIMLNEWEEDGKELWSMYSFFADENHAKSMLGLDKDNRNEFDTVYVRLTKLRLNLRKCRNWSKIVRMFDKAFDKIEIELYKD